MTQGTEAFAALHVPGQPLILYNIWDAGSAIAVEKAGAPALATGSKGVACAHGEDDGETLDFDLVLANLERIFGAVSVPVSLDVETGYGQTPAEVGARIAAVHAAGACGINLEDQDIANGGLRSTTDQCARIEAAAACGIFVNARTDIFIEAPPETHDTALVDQALERARAFRAAGAGSVFVPFLQDLELIRRFCAAAPLPVNILMRPGCPGHADLIEAGAARISHGHNPWLQLMLRLENEAGEIYRKFRTG